MVRLGWALAYYPARGVKGPRYDAEEAEAEAAQSRLVVGRDSCGRRTGGEACAS